MNDENTYYHGGIDKQEHGVLTLMNVLTHVNQLNEYITRISIILLVRI